MWTLLTVMVFAISAVVAYGASRAVANYEHSNAIQSFDASSAQVASTLELEIEHEEDLLVDLAAVVADRPQITNQQFRTFANAAHVLRRYPEVLDFGLAVIVPSEQLATFAAHATLHPPGGVRPSGPFVVTPPGRRPYYCLAIAGVARNAATDIPAAFDYCASSLTRTAALSSENAGTAAYVPFASVSSRALAVFSPVYRDGVTPTTPATRRAMFIGWIGAFVKPGVLLQRALAGHRAISVNFAYDSADLSASFTAGQIVPADAIFNTNLHNGWRVKTYAVVGAGSVASSGPALAVLVAGLASSLTIALVLLLLATGRCRALRLVADRTVELRHLALHDTLTGLPNRLLVVDRAEQLLLRNRRDGTEPCALCLDIDGFKSVNDSLGHSAGDSLLRAVTDRLTSVLRGVDTIGRLGGDEFVALLDGSALALAPQLLAERIIDVMRHPFILDSVARPVIITMSIGIATGDRPTAEQLLRDADIALCSAKTAGKGRFEVFRSEMEISVQRRSQLELALRSAMDSNEFHLAYQPIYDTETLSVLGAEVLLRWQHPILGAIGPDEFVPILESTGQIVDVGHWVLYEACHRVVEWRHYAPGFKIAVNVSARQLEENSVVEHVASALADTGLDASALTLEVTETALMHNIDSTAARLHELKALGVEISIDDFGTGYSSLAYIQRFPVDCLKIDRSFTTAISTSSNRDLLHTLVLLAKDLGARTIAEGVESQRQLDRLRDEHVNEVQGFLLAKPVSAELFQTEFIDFVAISATT